jgi:hypothetical protein
MGDIGVLPVKGSCCFGVGTNIADELTPKVVNGGENATRDDVRSIRENQISTGLSQDEYVGVKWSFRFGWFGRKLATL